MTGKTVMITLQVLLQALADKVDQDYANRIEATDNMRMVDKLEATAMEKQEKIRAVMQLAEHYYPTWADTDLNLLHFQQEAKEVSNA